MATPEEALPLADLREDLGIRSSLRDRRLARHRAAALAHVEQLVARNIVDRDDVEVRACIPERADQVIRFPVLDAKAPGAGAALAVRYRAAASARGPTRDATVDAGDVAIFFDRVEAWPPAEGWPAMREEAGVSIRVAAGMAADELPAEWAQAATLVARELYEGNALDSLPSGGVVDRLVRPYWRPDNP